MEFDIFQSRFKKSDYLYIVDIQDMGGNTLNFKLFEAVAVERERELSPSHNIELERVLGRGKPLEITEYSKGFEIKFSSYVSFCVTDESYFGSKKSEPVSGTKVRIYEDSYFLDYVAQCTFANTNYPGPLKHYQFSSLNHIVDVVSGAEPEIILIEDFHNVDFYNSILKNNTLRSEF